MSNRRRGDREEVFKLLDQVMGAEQTTEGSVRAMSLDAAVFPDTLWALHYPAENKYYVGTRDIGDVLIVTSSRELAECFLEAMPDDWSDGCVPRELGFDEARLEAKSRGLDALLLVDDPEGPGVHYVR